MMGASPTAVTALLAAVLLSLGGCGDDNPPPPPPSSSTPTSPSPTTSSPTSQAESAEEFIRRWSEANNEMKASGDGKALLALTRDCDPCERLVATVEGFYAAGGYVTTDGWSVSSVRRAPSQNQRRPVYIVDVVSSPTEYRESASGPIKRLPGGPARYRFSLLKQSSTFLVTDYMEMPL